MRFLLLFSRQGKLRLQKWFTPMSEREKKKIIRDMTSMVLSRQPRSCNFLHWKDLKIIYKRFVFSVFSCLNGFICLLRDKTPRFSAHSYTCFEYNLYLLCIFLRYASLYFCLAVENHENELLALEVIHRYVELLDKYFGNVFHPVSPSFILYLYSRSLTVEL